MGRTFTFVPLFLLLALWLVACTGSPVIATIPPSVDFGEIPATSTVTGIISIHNDGNRPLQIEDLRTSCGCTTAQVGETRIAAGADTLLTITFDPQAHPGLYGPLLRMVYVKSNDPNQPELEIPVTVNILSPEEASQ